MESGGKLLSIRIYYPEAEGRRKLLSGHVEWCEVEGKGKLLSTGLAFRLPPEIAATEI